MLKGDRVRVNGAPERVAKRVIAPADHVEVLPRHARPLDRRLRILFEDDAILVVDKEAGLLTVPTPTVVHETAETLLNSYVGAPPGQTRVFHVHRLDRDTSGVLVFAKGEFMRDRLQALFAEHDIERAYVAIVHGKLRPPAGTLRSFLAEDRDLRVRTVADAKLGKEAVTRYRTVASGPRASILELALETGRRHQIRVQLAAAGHPVVGDRIYGRDEDPLGRLALHARRLAFVRPDTGRRVELTAEPPASFRNFGL
jgi:23S rRNA pseudouridine1911/1915/1917 synthase